MSLQKKTLRGVKGVHRKNLGRGGANYARRANIIFAPPPQGEGAHLNCKFKTFGFLET